MTHPPRPDSGDPGNSAPPSTPLRTGVLIAATLTTGLTAGVFVNWSNVVMPGLSDVDDRTLVTAFKALDSAIFNPLFIGVCFMGALLLTALSAVLHRGPSLRPVLRWIGAALLCYLLAVLITFGIHEPLNQEIRDLEEPLAAADFAAARDQLDEAMWTTWNTVRAVLSTLAFGLLAWSLVTHRQAPRPSTRRLG